MTKKKKKKLIINLIIKHNFRISIFHFWKSFDVVIDIYTVEAIICKHEQTDSSPQNTVVEPQHYQNI